MTILDRAASSKNKEDNSQARQTSSDNGNTNRKQRTRAIHPSRDRSLPHGLGSQTTSNIEINFWPDPSVAPQHRTSDFSETAHLQLQHENLGIIGQIKPRGLSKSVVVVPSPNSDNLHSINESAVIEDSISPGIPASTDATHSVSYSTKGTSRIVKKSGDKKVSHKKKRRNLPYQNVKSSKGAEKLNAQSHRMKNVHSLQTETKISADASTVIPLSYSTADNQYHKSVDGHNRYKFGDDKSSFGGVLDGSKQYNNLPRVPPIDVPKTSTKLSDDALEAPNRTGYPDDLQSDASDVKNNSDDEHDQGRLKQLHKGVDFNKLENEFEEKLKKVRGFIIKPMEEDGACLFRAVADQVYGDQGMHDEVRKNCMNYMKKNADYFSNYVTEDFEAYITRKQGLHEFGNHLEMQAMAELYNRPFEVYQYSTDPINTFQTSHPSSNAPIRVSYHQNSHYNSVIDPYVATIGVGLGLPSFTPGLVDKTMVNAAVKASCEIWEQQMLNDKVQATDWENTDDAILEQVARESYMEYIEKKSSDIACVDVKKPDGHKSAVNDNAKESSKPDQVKVVKEFPKKPSKAPNPSASDWVAEEDEWQVISQVLANSQQEYMDALKHQATHSRATCSKYT